MLDPALKKRVINEGLNPYLKDNPHAWHLEQNGSYIKRKARAKQIPYSAQDYLAATLGAQSVEPEH